MKNKVIALRLLAILVLVVPMLVSCAQPTPQVVEKIVEKPVTVVIEKEKIVPQEKVVEKTVVVTKEVVKEKEVVKVVTPTVPPTAAPTPLPAVSIPFKNPDTLIIATIGEPESLDPAWTYETAGAEVEFNIYDSMIFFKRTKADEFVPVLAEKWEVSADGLTYTFYIRKGVKFHKGGTLEPHDIAYSIQRGLLQDRTEGPQWLLLEPILGVSSIADLAMEMAKVDDFEKVPQATLTKVGDMVKAAVSADDAKGTVTIKLASVAPWFLQILAQPWGCAYDMEWMVQQGDWDGKSDTWKKWHDPAAEKSVLFNQANGTGPYMLESWKPGEAITLVANENYWRTEPIWEGGPKGPARIKRVVIKLVEEWGTRFAMLQAGDADMVAIAPAYYPQVDPLVKDAYLGEDASAKKEEVNPKGALRVFKNLLNPAMTPAMFNFKINVEGGNPFIGTGKLDGSGIPPDFFSDIHVRKAFNYCFDWPTFIKDALRGEGIQPRGPIIAGMLGYDEKQPVYSYDLKKAEEEFKLAWDGKLWETGFYVQLAYNTGNDTRRIAAEVLKKNIESLNPKFNIVVLNLPWPTYLATRRERKLPISISGWLEDYHDPSNWVHPFMHCGAGAYAVAQSFPEDLCKKFEELIDKGVASVDPKVREPIYKELQNLAYENAIDIFLYQAVGRHYEQLWIEGWYNNPLYPGTWFYALNKVKP